MLVVSMSASVDGFATDRDGGLSWGAPSDELFAWDLERVGALGGYVLGRRLFEAMRVWEDDPAMRSDPARAAFADVWRALPKVVFSRTLGTVPGTARLARAPLAEEVARVLASTDRDVQIGGMDLAGQAVELGLVDELHLLRHPVVLGGGTPLLPAVARPVALELAGTRTFPAGVVLERYRRT